MAWTHITPTKKIGHILTKRHGVSLSRRKIVFMCATNWAHEHHPAASSGDMGCKFCTFHTIEQACVNYKGRIPPHEMLGFDYF